MKLFYRGVSHDYNPFAIKTVETGVTGHYRGLNWRFHAPVRQPILQTNLNLLYRGQPIASASSPSASLAEPETVNASHRDLEPSLEPRQLARQLMMQHHGFVRNRQQAMLSRMAHKVGMTDPITEHWNRIQGKILPGNWSSYDRTHVALS